MPAILAFLLLACRAGSFRHKHGAFTQRGDWIVTSAANRIAPRGVTSEFRGTFRDFSLWKDPSKIQKSGVQDQTWVIEYSSPAALEKDWASLKPTNLTVLFREGNSLVIQGEVPEVLGTGGCENDETRTVVPVSDEEVIIKSMAKPQADKYRASAQAKDPAILSVLELISSDNMKAVIEKLVSFKTRESYSGAKGLDPAVDWAAEVLTGYGFTVQRDNFQPGSWWKKRITPQILAEVKGTESDRVVVLGAHIDAVAGYRASTVPGADDNGSGSAAVMEMARIIALSGVKFKHTVSLMLYTGEEQGLFGSKAVASRWKREKKDVIGMINLDMISYRKPGSPPTVAVERRNVDRDLTAVLEAAAKTYVGDRAFIGDATGCCSDQQSWYENGFPAAGFFESTGPNVIYPKYHTPSDTLEYVDTEQLELQTTAVAATVMTLAEVST